jgi:hypothetical protein
LKATCTPSHTSGSEVWRSSNGIDWNPVFVGGLGDPNNVLGYGFKVFQDNLFLVTGNLVTGAEVWRTPDGTTWHQVGFGGWGDPLTAGSFWDNSIAIFNDRLFVGTVQNWNVPFTGGKIWMYLPNTVFLPLTVRDH